MNFSTSAHGHRVNIIWAGGNTANVVSIKTGRIIAGIDMTGRPETRAQLLAAADAWIDSQSEAGVKIAAKQGRHRTLLVNLLWVAGILAVLMIPFAMFQK